MVWSDQINAQVDDYLNKTFNGEKFIGIHLRNGDDWNNACNLLNDKDGENYSNFMASPQCLDNSNIKLTHNLCFPTVETIFDDLDYAIKKVLKKKVKNIYIATDKNPMIKEIKKRYKGIIENVVHHDPWLAVLDVAILARSEYFIGNCVSSFTSFVKRERDLLNKPSTFWGVKH